MKWRDHELRRADESEIRDWWGRWPDANVIIITGAISGVVVVDGDPRHGGDDSLRELNLPETLTALTGGGGEHRYFRHPGFEIRNAAGVLPGIDFRGDGGYVIAPPSQHASGRTYEWDFGQPEEPVELPASFRKLLGGQASTIGDMGLPTSVRLSADFDLPEILQAGIRHGVRDDTLARIAGHFLGQGDDEGKTILQLQGINAMYCRSEDGRHGDPLPPDDVVRIVRSIGEKEAKKRAVREELEARVNGAKNGDLPASDRIVLAREAWASLDILGVTRWRIQLGDSERYLVSTDDAEVSLGPDLYNQRHVKAKLLAVLGAGLKVVSARDWPRWAVTLRGLAEEEHVEGTRASQRVNEWIEAFVAAKGVADPAPEGRASALAHRGILIDGTINLSVPVLRKFIDMKLGEKVTAHDVRGWLKAAGWSRRTVRTGTSTMSVWASTAPFSEQ